MKVSIASTIYTKVTIVAKVTIVIRVTFTIVTFTNYSYFITTLSVCNKSSRIFSLRPSPRDLLASLQLRILAN